MSGKPYLERDTGGFWAISREVAGRTVYFIEGRAIDDLADAVDVLWVLGMAPTSKNMDRYFPMRKDGLSRTPTLDLLELFAHLGETGSEVGV